MDRFAPFLLLLLAAPALAGWHPDSWEQLRLARALGAIAQHTPGIGVIGASEDADRVLADMFADGRVSGVVAGEAACTVVVVPQATQRWELALRGACPSLELEPPPPAVRTGDRGLRVFVAALTGESLGYMAGALVGMNWDRQACGLRRCVVPPSTAASLPLAVVGGTVLGAMAAPPEARRAAAVRGLQVTSLTGFALLALDDTGQTDARLYRGAVGFWALGAPLAMALRTGGVLKKLDAELTVAPGIVNLKGRF